MPDGVIAYVHYTGRRRFKLCIVCRDPASILCDHRTTPRKTCDAPLCAKHARHVGPDRDLCPSHAADAPSQEGLGL